MVTVEVILKGSSSCRCFSMEICFCIVSFQIFCRLDSNRWGLRRERLRVMGLKVVVVVVVVVGRLVLEVVLGRWEVWRVGSDWEVAGVVFTWEKVVAVPRWEFWIGRLWQRLEVRDSRQERSKHMSCVWIKHP